jgi:hypothetical protein
MKNNTFKIIILIVVLIVLLIFIINYKKIPSLTDHVNRNKYNVFPIGYLSHIKDDKYVDKNNIIWIRRGFLNSLLHNPFEYYVFETYDINNKSSSEVEILKKDFNNGRKNFKPASFNYYSSFNSPISHFFADILPIIIYLFPEYNIYKN